MNMNKKVNITNSRAWLAYPLPFLLALVAMAGQTQEIKKADHGVDSSDLFSN